MNKSTLILIFLMMLIPAISVQGDNPSVKIQFVDVTKEAKLDGLIPPNNAQHGRATWVDLNGDGYPELLSQNQVFLNLKDGTFQEITGQAGLAHQPSPGAMVADFNNDGHRDIYFYGNDGALYLNDGKHHFHRGQAALNTDGANNRAQGAGCGDIDGDGWLDVYVANYEEQKNNQFHHSPDIILKNDQGELKKYWQADDNHRASGRGVTFCDFNQDHQIDIYISNYRLQQNFLWVNQGKGSFIDQGKDFKCAGNFNKPVEKFKNLAYIPTGHTIGSLWADFDNDGLFDLFVANFSHPPSWQDRSQFLKNLGKDHHYHFADKSHLANIPWQESYANPAAADVDNDGMIDLYFTNQYDNGDRCRLFRNLGNWQFEDITQSAQIDLKTTYQAAWGDFNNDGLLDLFSKGRLLKNVSKNPGHWLKVNLQGKGCNHDGVGAQVLVRTKDNKKFLRQVEVGTGTGNQNDLTLHFGIGPAKRFDIGITWPCGSTQIEKGSHNKTYFIEETKHIN